MPHYKLTAPNGKSYHGITTLTVNRRMTGHRTAARNGSKYPLHAAIRKYGFDAFKLEVLSESKNRDELHRLEIEAIARDDTFAPNGYNLTAGGDGTSSHEVSEEHRLAIGTRMKERWDDEAFAEMKRRNSSETAKRLNANPEHKAKLQAGSRAYWSNPENVAKRTERLRKLREAEPERFVERDAAMRAGAIAYWSDQSNLKTQGEKVRQARAAQTPEKRREIAALAVATRANRKVERDAKLASMPSEEARAIREEARAKKAAETKAGRAAAKAARSPEEQAASKERYRQAALRRTPEQKEKLRLARIAAIEVKRRATA